MAEWFCEVTGKNVTKVWLGFFFSLFLFSFLVELKLGVLCVYVCVWKEVECCCGLRE